MAQSVERRIGSAEVTGPIPVSSCIKNLVNFKVCKVFSLSDWLKKHIISYIIGDIRKRKRNVV